MATWLWAEDVDRTDQPSRDRRGTVGVLHEILIAIAIVLFLVILATFSLWLKGSCQDVLHINQCQTPFEFAQRIKESF